MGNEIIEAGKNKFTWVIKNFKSLPSEKIYSDQFVIGGCKWRLLAFPKGNKTANNINISLYLDVAESESLPKGWKRHVNFTITIVDQLFKKPSQRRETVHWFNEKESEWGFTNMLPLTEIFANAGFLLNGELEIIAKVDVVEVIGPLDVFEETTSANGSVDVKGFLVLPSQVKSVNRLFEKHPDIAMNVQQNQYLKTGYMNVLLSLTNTLRRTPKEISKDDLADAYAALESMTNAGYKLDWLVKKFNRVSQMKKNDEADESRMQEIEEELKNLKHKCSDLEAQLEKKKAEVSAPIRFANDDFEESFKWFGQ